MSYTEKPDLYDWNIEKSLEKHIRDKTTGTLIDDYPILFRDTEFRITTEPRWIQIVWVSFSATIFSLNSFQVRCFSRPENDRFGREHELMAGRVRLTLEHADIAAGITFYDVMGTAKDASPSAIQYDGEDLKIAIRYTERGPTMDGSELGEASAYKGVSLIALSYNAHVARTSVPW